MIHNIQDDDYPITFAGGPTFMPPYLKSPLQANIFSAASYLNINSNNKQFNYISQQARNNIRQILSVPSDHHIWFLGSSGCHLQFAGIPLNFIGNNNKNTANYTTTGYFSKLSFKEANRYCQAKCIADITYDRDGMMTLPQEYDYHPQAVYTHLVENQSAQGLYYPVEKYPIQPGIPLIIDNSSSFLTRPIDWSKTDILYAHAQKNCGISGLTIMIVNSKLQTSPSSILPQLCSFQNYKKKGGYYADMNALPIYANMLATSHVKQNGGLNLNQYSTRSKRLYQIIQKYKVYTPKVNKMFRSQTTITWDIKDQNIKKMFSEQAKKSNLFNLEGHRTQGGFRASLFCPIPDKAVYRLADFMQEFASKYE